MDPIGLAPGSLAACPSCGQQFTIPGAVQYVTRVEHHYHDGKSPGLAAVLSFLIPGLGQLYNGDVLAGVMLFIAVVACVVTSFFIVPAFIALILWVWGIVNAYNAAESRNRRRRKRS